MTRLIILVNLSGQYPIFHRLCQKFGLLCTYSQVKLFVRKVLTSDYFRNADVYVVEVTDHAYAFAS